MHAYFCSIIRKRVGMKREAGTKEERRNRCYIYLGCRRSWLEVRSIIFYRACPWKERNPKASFFLLLQLYIRSPSNVLSPTRKTFDTFVTAQLLYAISIISRNFLLPPFPLDSTFFFVFSFFLFSFFFFLFFFSFMYPHTTLFPLSGSQVYSSPPRHLRLPRARSPLTPSPSPSPSPSLSFSVWRWPQSINNSRLWVSFGDSQLDLGGARSNYLRSPAEEECSLSAQHVQIIFDWRGGRRESIVVGGRKILFPVPIRTAADETTFLREFHSFLSSFFLYFFWLDTQLPFKHAYVLISFFFFSN